MIKVGAKGIFVISGAVSGAAALATALLLSAEQQCDMLTFFQDKMCQPLFAGLLTTAAFLFSLKTFIIVTMKQNVYGTTEYEKGWREKLAIDPAIKRYQPLRNFALLLFLSVLTSLVSAVAQFTLGLVPNPIAAVVCLSLAAWSIIMIFISLIFLQINLQSWFRFLDDSSK